MYGDFASQEKRKSQENKSQVELMIIIDHHLTMKTILRRQQVESLACGCAVSNGTAKLMVHFKRYKH